MIHVVIIVVMVEPDRDPRWEYVQEYQDRQEQEYRRQIDELRGKSHQVTCSCGWTEWYQTPGRAQMGLRAHQQRRKCRRT
jgi:hypothetical protein